jgi:aminocarboxymuconate-semialdehyde decarboxylase
MLEGPIDLHAHVCPEDFPESPAGMDRWPCMVCEADGRRELTIDGKPFRMLDARSWDSARRLDDMDADGVAVQGLSPMPELLSYWFPPSAAELMCDHVNANIAAMIGDAPKRFCGLGMVPLQAPEAAVAYLPRVKEVFGLQGIEIGSNIEGAVLGDSRFDPIFAAAEALDLAIFVHALHPLATRGLSPPELINLAGFPLDTGLAAASVIVAGVASRFPRLRIGFSHGGGALPSMLGRLEKGWQMTDGFRGNGAEQPSLQAARMFYDSNVYDPKILAHLVSKVAPEHVFLGTDYPYAIQQRDPLAYLAANPWTAAEAASLEHGAARRFLGLAPPTDR